VEVKIGIQSVPREPRRGDRHSGGRKSRVSWPGALTSDHDSVFAVTMSKGGKILVPADKIAYVEFGGTRGASASASATSPDGACRVGLIDSWYTENDWSME